MIYRVIIFLFSFLLLMGCRSKTKEKTTSKLPNSFLTFYDRFHTDSAFQMNHIVFPLSGTPGSLDTISDSKHFQWKKANWKLHRPVEIKEFKKHYAIIDSTLITEYIYHPKGYGLERRFAKMNHDWYLIYYGGMSKME